jgi:hypothetical protein
MTLCGDNWLHEEPSLKKSGSSLEVTFDIPHEWLPKTGLTVFTYQLSGAVADLAECDRS